MELCACAGTSINGDGSLAIIGELFGGGGLSHHGPGRARIYSFSTGQWSQVATLQDDENAQLDDGFGASVDISGSFAVIAAPNRDGVEDKEGAVYFFENVNSVWLQRPEVFYGAPGSGFGGSVTRHDTVAIDGQLAVVGASDADVFYQGQIVQGAGVVHVYFRGWTGEWIPEVTLPAPVPVANEKFGYSVDLSGFRVIVGAPREFNNPTAPGKAYIFKRTTPGGVPTWSLEGTALVGDNILGDHFGWSVSIDGNSALVGAPDIGAGDAFVFGFNPFAPSGQWEEQAQLEPSNGQTGQLFGYNVCMSGSLLLVGANSYDPPGGPGDVGAAYVFQRRSLGAPWSEELILLSSVGASGDRVGETLALRGDEALWAS